MDLKKCIDLKFTINLTEQNDNFLKTLHLLALFVGHFG